MKDVAACDKSRGGGKQPVIRECPNGETFADELSKLTSEYIGCERELGEVKHLSSQRKRKKVYADFCHWALGSGLSGDLTPPMTKICMIPLVAASETGRAKTNIINFCQGLDASLTTNGRASLGFRDVGVAGRDTYSPRSAEG